MKKLVFIAILLFLNSAFAELITNAEEPADPKIAIEDGKPIIATWKDGREAASRIRIVPNFTGTVPLSIYENTCTGITTSNCGFVLGVMAYQVHMQWTKHPDASKMGKTVAYTIKDFPGKIDLVAPQTNPIISTVDKIRRPKAAKNVPDDHLVCEDYKFLPRDPMQTPHTRIIRWETEIMLNNPETGGTENRSLGGALDVELIPHADKSGLLIQVRGGYTSAFPGGEVLFQGDIISLTLRDREQKICQVGMKPDVSAIMNAANTYLANLPNNFEPYVIGGDEFSPKIKAEFKRVLESPKVFIVE